MIALTSALAHNKTLQQLSLGGAEEEEDDEEEEDVKTQPEISQREMTQTDGITVRFKI